MKPYITKLQNGYSAGIVKPKYFTDAESADESLKAAKLMKPDAQKEIWPGFTYTENEFRKRESFADDIQKYVDESRDKFIKGDLKLSKWKSYVDKLKSMGVDDYLQTEQTAYDRYRKA